MASNKFFDSCCYPIKLDHKNLIEQKKIFKKNKIFRVCLNIKKYNLNNYVKIINLMKKINFFIPIFHYQNKISANKQFNLIKKSKFNIIKIHPRFMKKDLRKDFNFFKKIFIECEKRKLNIMICTFSSFQKKVLDYDYLMYLSRLINLTKKSKVILMHGGGTQLISFYEKFRFKENVILDLSYTAQHFFKTSVFQDILFLIKKFDRRLIIGTDYPTISLEVFNTVVNYIFKNIKNKKKFNNICYKNLENIIYGL